MQLRSDLLSRLFAAAVAAALSMAAVAQDGTVVYKGARILPGGKPAIEQGVLIVSGGKMRAAVAAGARSARRGISVRARSSISGCG